MDTRTLRRGVSLIELVIYIGIFVTVAGFLTGIFVNFVGVQSKEAAGAEVTSQLNFVLQKIQLAVKESSNIEISTSSVTSNLKLRMPSSSSADPTCIYLSSGKVRIVQGPDNPNPLLASQNCKADSEAQDLTNNKVMVDKLEFKKANFGAGHDTVSVDLQMTYNTSNPRLSVSKTLQSAIGRVSAATFDSDLIPNTAYNFSLGQSAKGWGTVYVSDGAAGTPSYTFGAQTNIGMFRPANNNLGFSTQGIERMRIDANGNIGVGTTNPGDILEVSVTKNSYVNPGVGGVGYLKVTDKAAMAAGVGGGITFAGSYTGSSPTVGGAIQILKENATDGQYGFTMAFHTRQNGSTNGERMRINSTGDVGIGTTEPSAKLDVNGLISSRLAGSGTASTAIRVGALNFDSQWSTWGSMRVGMNSDNGTLKYTTSNGNGVGSLSLQDGAFYFDNGVSTGAGNTASLTTRLSVLANGNVGIGTGSPNSRLHVSGGAVIFDNPSGAARWRKTAGVDSNDDLGIWGNGAPFYIADWNTGTKGIAINTTSGNVGIGTIDPAARLFVKSGDNYAIAAQGGVGTNAVWLGNRTGITNGTPAVQGFTASFASTDLTLQPEGGSVGIGTATPKSKLQVTGGDIYIDGIDRGVVLRTPDGTNCYRAAVNNSGTLITQLVTCP